MQPTRALWSSCRIPYLHAVEPPVANPLPPVAAPASSRPGQRSRQKDRWPASSNRLAPLFPLPLKQRLGDQQNAAQRLQRLWSRLLPKLALGCLQQPLRNRVPRPRIRSIQELTHLSRRHLVLGQSLIDKVRRNLCRRIESEDIVHRSRQFQPSL